jgi:hypothetical protein
MRQGGAPGLVVGASDDLKRRRRTSAGARVSVSDEKSLREEELGNLGFNPSGGTPLYRPRRAASSSRTSK